MTRRSWTLSDGARERIVLTTEPERYAQSSTHRMDPWDLGMLVDEWLASRTKAQELAELYAALSHAAAIPTTWRRHELERVVGSFIVDACRSGRLVALRSPVFAEARGKAGPGPRTRPQSQPPPPPSSRPKPKTTVTYFEARYTDEIGEPIVGASVELEVGSKHPRVTDGAGECRLDGAREEFGRVRATDLSALREILRPRWDAIREGPWLEPQADHSFHPLEEGREIGAQLLAEALHTVVVQPWCIRARLFGMYFDTNKAFLLPSAMPGIRGIKGLYDEHPSSHLLVVGHTDTTGDPWYNDPLSLERADSVAAFLTDDVDAWYAWYAPSNAFEKRWGAHEDRLMLTSLADFEARPADESPIRWYQRTRGLEVTGLANEATRRRLIAEYMAHDETTLPTGTQMTTHGCGESFPLSDDEIAAIASHIPEQDRVEHRRVELYFFDKALGIQPPPPGELSRSSSPEYPEWRRRARETHDFSERISHPVWMRLKDVALHPVKKAVCRIVDRPDVGYLEADDGGWVLVPTRPDDTSYDLEWTTQEGVNEPAWPYGRRVFIDFASGDERGRRMLTNLGYDGYTDLGGQVRAFQREFGREPTGQLSDIIGELEPWHGGGPPPAKSPSKEDGEAQAFADPPAQQQQPAPPGRRPPGTTAPKRVSALDLGVVQGGKKIPPNELTIDLRIAGSTGSSEPTPTPKEVGVELHYLYAGLTIDETYSIRVVRRDAAGGVSGYAATAHKITAPKKPGDINHVGLVLEKPVVTFSEEPTHLYGFDKYETVKYLFSSQKKSSEKLPPAMHAISIAQGSGKVGKIKVDIAGVAPDQVFFRSSRVTVCSPKVTQAAAASFVLEVDSVGSNMDETDVHAVVGSESGPIVASFRVLLLKEVTHGASVFNIFDPSNTSTKVAAPATLPAVEAGVAKHWKSVVAKAKLGGSLTARAVAYDHYNSGTMVTGMDSKTPGEKAVFAAVGGASNAARVTLVLVKKLEQAFFLTVGAAPGDKKITVRKSGSDSVRSVPYTLRDTAGNSETVQIKKVNSTTGEVELAGPIKNRYRVTDDAAIFHALNGQNTHHRAGSGFKNVVYVVEQSPSNFIHTVAHELGHDPGGLAGCAEIDNLMCDDGGNKPGLRYRSVKQYYKPGSRQSQWRAFKR